MGDGRYEAVLAVAEPTEISGKDAAWFNGAGCALASSVYLTACLFAQMKKVRDDFPYLQLAAGDDTRLAALLLGVHQGYLSGLGIFYVTGCKPKQPDSPDHAGEGAAIAATCD